MARRGVTVNAVAPGLIETAFTEEVLEGDMAKAIPARRIGTPEEVAACIRFLASAGSFLRDRNDADRGRRPQRLAASTGQRRIEWQRK